MKYRVLWSPDAESEIESILARADDRSQVTASAQLIDGRLLESPHEFGESRASGLRIGFERPLGIVFEILEDVATVIVFDVWRTDRK